MNKKILFVTGTRADYGKMKSLMQILEKSVDFEVYIFVCGMHLSKTLGSTYEEVIKDGFKNIHVAYGLIHGVSASINLGNTISYLSGYVDNIEPDMIIVHGDRIDALAGATVGALHNIMVGHIEGGELSGTIDESIRHAISKFAHVHFVCTEEARERLIQLGEEKARIYVIGSPDIDIMLNKQLPDIKAVKERYNISFDHYGILMYHPVTTEYQELGQHIKEVVDAVIASHRKYVVIFPNNDLGSEIILHEYERLKDNNFRIFPSLRFEYFLTLLKYSDFMIGNSSAGIREAGIYGVPAIDIGTRQQGRYCIDKTNNIIHTNDKKEEIITALANIEAHSEKTQLFGDGNSTQRFFDIINKKEFWDTAIQKRFVDFRM